MIRLSLILLVSFTFISIHSAEAAVVAGGGGGSSSGGTQSLTTVKKKDDAVIAGSGHNPRTVPPILADTVSPTFSVKIDPNQCSFDGTTYTCNGVSGSSITLESIDGSAPVGQ